MTDYFDTCMGGKFSDHPQVSRYVMKIWNIPGIKIMKVRIKSEQRFIIKHK